jgi:two-component system nitrogen regulation sensor histidine kinase NtrY
VFTRLIEAEQSVATYRDAQNNRERIQAVFALSYVETALLVLWARRGWGSPRPAGIAAPVGPAGSGGGPRRGRRPGRARGHAGDPERSRC